MISIVVPVYKVEQYLSRCVESLLAQKYDDYEIILVDDGSPDNCPQMCDEWAEKDNRIRVVHKQNGGLSSARNAGLKVACGKYVGFVDSDDDVEPDMYAKMITAAEQENADFVMADYKRITADGKETIITKGIRGGFYSRENMRKEIFPQLIMAENVDYGPLLSVWCCMYRREFLLENSIKFAEDVKWSEDNLFNSIVGYCASSFYYLKDEALYHYYENPGTITTSYRKGAWEVYNRMNRHLSEFFMEKEDFDFRRQLKLHHMYYACNTLNMECAEADSFSDAIKRSKDVLFDEAFRKSMKAFKLPAVHMKLKIQLFLIREGWTIPLVLFLRRR